MKRELKSEERDEIVRAIAAGDRVKAISIYLSATEGNLTEAQNFIRTVRAGDPDGHVKKFTQEGPGQTRAALP